MTARDWASSVHAPIKWTQLEVEAFAEHPEIREQLDPTHRFGRIRGGTLRRQLWLAVPVAVLLGAGFLAPIAGWAILYNGRFGMADLSPEFAVAAGGILFGVGLVAMLLNGISWLARDLRWNRLRAIHAGTTLGVGLLSIPVVALRSPGVPGAAVWITLVAVTTALSAIVSIMAIRSFAGHRPVVGTTTIQSGQLARLARIDEMVAELAPAERRAVRADIAAALAQLRQRGLISPKLMARAERAELGHLAIAISSKRTDRPDA